MLPNYTFDKSSVSLDVLILLLLTPAYIKGQNAYLVVVSLLAYVLLGLWLPLVNNEDRPSRFSFILRYALLLIIATAAVIVPTTQNIITRYMTPVEADGFSPAYVTLSDSALQTELALDYLNDKRNPYTESYKDTPIQFYQWADVGQLEWQDPVYSYFVYLPGTLWLSFPMYNAALALGIPYDQRIIYLLVYIILLLTLPHAAKTASLKLSIVAAIGLNPLFTDSILLGMNDVAPFLGLTLAVLALTRRRFMWAAFFIGIACALKQYAWFVVPFFIFYVWEQSAPTERWRTSMKALAFIGTIVFVTLIPFLLWDPQALYTDTLAFPAGRADFLYPIRGFTIGRLLMGAGIIPTFVSPFPFQLLQIIFGLPLLLFSLKYQYSRGLGAMLLASSIFIFGFGYLSRFFHENYVGVVIAWGTLGILMSFAGKEED